MFSECRKYLREHLVLYIHVQI